jgi:hypothetical protein
MKTDAIISYGELVAAERINLQKGMVFGAGRSYSILLMSVRAGSPYSDAIDKKTGDLLYEGHDLQRSPGGPDPKKVDQPLLTPNGKWTENGKFLRAAIDYQSGIRARAETVKVYEKISRGIWCYKGFFELVGARIAHNGTRYVFKFRLRPIEKRALGRVVELPHTRMIPTPVKIEVWARDGGRCALCGSERNLHFDHIIPFSKGGSSLVAANIRLLCAKHNLQKSDKIIGVLPWVGTATGAIGSIASKN